MLALTISLFSMLDAPRAQGQAVYVKDHTVLRIDSPSKAAVVSGSITVQAELLPPVLPVSGARCQFVIFFQVDSEEFMPPAKHFVQCDYKMQLAFQWNTSEILEDGSRRFPDGPHTARVNVWRRSTVEERWYDDVRLVVENGSPPNATATAASLDQATVFVGIGVVALFVAIAVVLRAIRKTDSAGFYFMAVK